MSRKARIVSTALVFVLLTACTSQNQVLLPGPGALSARLYVGNGDHGVVANQGKMFVFNQPVTSSSSPSASIVIGNSGSDLESFAFDSTNVYVADCDDHLVRAVARPVTSSSTQAFAFAAPGPDGLVADGSGNLYAANDCAGGPDTITVYTPPISSSTTASVTVADASNISALNQEVIDNTNTHLYVAQCSSTKQVLEYNLPLSNSSTAAVAVTISGDNCDDGIAIDPVTNQLIVASHSVNKIYAFNLPISNSSTPALTITTSNASQAWFDIAVDAAGNLYAADDGTKAVDVFVPPFSASSNPAFSLTPAAMDSPRALAIGP